MGNILQAFVRILGLVIIFFAIFQISEYGETILKNLGVDISNQAVRTTFNINDQINNEIPLEENNQPIFSIIDIPALLFLSLLLLGFSLLSVEYNYFSAIIKRGVLTSPYAIERNTNILIKQIKSMSDNYYAQGASGLKRNEIKSLPVWPLLIEHLELKLPFQDIFMIIGNDASFMRKYYDRLIKIVNNLSNIAPSLGVVGTVLGLIKLLFNLEDPSNLGPSMALALMTTFYGLIFSVIIFKPLVMRLESNKLALMNSYQHASFWLGIIETKKPSFYLEQKYS